MYIDSYHQHNHDHHHHLHYRHQINLLMYILIYIFSIPTTMPVLSTWAQSRRTYIKTPTTLWKTLSPTSGKYSSTVPNTSDHERKRPEQAYGCRLSSRLGSRKWDWTSVKELYEVVGRRDWLNHITWVIALRKPLIRVNFQKRDWILKKHFNYNSWGDKLLYILSTEYNTCTNGHQIMENIINNLCELFGAFDTLNYFWVYVNIQC